MEIYVIKDKWHLAPADQDSLTHIKKLKNDKHYKVKITEFRNYKFLQKYMVMISLGYENTQIVNMETLEPIPKDDYRKLMQKKAGLFNEYSGESIEISVSYEKMNEEQFEEIYPKVKQQVAKDLGVTSEVLELQVLEQF